MDNATSSFLAQHMGQKMIRTAPAATGRDKTEVISLPYRGKQFSIQLHTDYSYMEKDPVIFTGITEDGRIKCIPTGELTNLMGNGEIILLEYFSDTNWTTYEEAITPDPENPLNKWIGEKIIRICPSTGRNLYTFTRETGCILVAASKNHILVEYPTDSVFAGERTLLGADFANPNDWIKYETATQPDPNNPLNKWVGKKIMRIRPTALEDHTFMDKDGCILVAASKYHVLVEYTSIGLEGERTLLGPEFANPEDWKLG